MILPIHTDSQKILRQQAAPVTGVTPELRQLAQDMRETMHNAQGVGLAAPQVGQSVQLIVVELDDKEDRELSIPFMALLNPRVTWKSPSFVPMVEACLSIPGVEASVRRHSKVRVKAQDLEGGKIEVTASGLLARVLQHEIDHLHGKLFTDYIPKAKLEKRRLVEYPRI